jgi:type IV secretion system protein VirB11
MTLRKHPARVYPLADWVTKGILTPAQCASLRTALRDGQTIAISGAIGSSKTSLLNALLHELRDTDERLIVVEDDPEIVCEVLDCEFQRTVRDLDGQAAVSMEALCRDLLRLSPDRVVIGELRGAEALPAMQALATGHPGLFTVHARTAEATLLRLEQLIQITSVDPQRALIAEAVNVICHMEWYGRLWALHGAAGGGEGPDRSGLYITRSLMER